MARSEEKLGLKATYFLQLTSRFYNIFEPDITSICREISSLGHDIGIHFDPSSYPAHSPESFRKYLDLEVSTIQNLLDVSIHSFSLHNPTTFDAESIDHRHYGRLFNASSPQLFRSFSYCSDSNGVWRFDNLYDVISNPNTIRLYSLTHPEWWQDTLMPPRDRIMRSINGRLTSSISYYDELLRFHNRPNINH